MKTFKTDCDMGSVKTFSDNLACFFDNGFGDATTTVDIYTKKSKEIEKLYRKDKIKFLGHFTARRKNSTALSNYDCGNEAVYFFKPGRWFVYRIRELHLIIVYQDSDTNA